MAFMLLTPGEWQALLLSLRVAAVAVLASLPVGVAVGGGAGTWEVRGEDTLDVAVNLPLVLPPVVTGYLLLVIFGRQGIGPYLERWGDSHHFHLGSARHSRRRWWRFH